MWPRFKMDARNDLKLRLTGSGVLSVLNGNEANAAGSRSRRAGEDTCKQSVCLTKPDSGLLLLDWNSRSFAAFLLVAEIKRTATPLIGILKHCSSLLASSPDLLEFAFAVLLGGASSLLFQPNSFLPSVLESANTPPPSVRASLNRCAHRVPIPYLFADSLFPRLPPAYMAGTAHRRSSTEILFDCEDTPLDQPFSRLFIVCDTFKANVVLTFIPSYQVRLLRSGSAICVPGRRSPSPRCTRFRRSRLAGHIRYERFLVKPPVQI